MERTKLYCSALLLFICIFFTSCFEIVEELYIKKNGAGNFTFTLNMSESKTKLASIMMLDSVQGYKIPNKHELQKQTQIVNQKLKQIAGLSNVGTKLDLNEYIAEIKFDFTNVQQINQAMKVLIEYYKIRNYSVPHYAYTLNSKQLTRTYNSKTTTINAYNKMKQADKNVFQQAKYTSIYRFEDEISSSTNATTKISKNKKAAMQQTNLLNIVMNNTNINQQITTK